MRVALLSGVTCMRDGTGSSRGGASRCGVVRTSGSVELHTHGYICSGSPTYLLRLPDAKVRLPDTEPGGL